MKCFGLSDVFRFGASLISFLCFRVARAGVRSLIYLKNRASAGKQSGWIGLSELAGKSWGVAFLVVTAPRWNCHATLALTDPFRVDSEIALALPASEESAQQYTFVIYPERGNPFTPTREHQQDGTIRLPLAPGIYRLGARYYDAVADPVFPEVRADGAVQIPRRCLTGQRDRYQALLESIRNKKTLGTGVLHYYMYYLLRWRVGGDAFLKREFLPVGNPDTEFEYDAFQSGDRVEIQGGEGSGNQRVYLTCFNRHSFPVRWDRIEAFPYQTTVDFDGFYLLRRIRPME